MDAEGGASERTEATAFGELVGVIVTEDGTGGGEEAGELVSVLLPSNRRISER